MPETAPGPIAGPQRLTLMTTASNAHTVVTVLGLALSGVLYLLVPGALATASVGVLSPDLGPTWAAALLLGGLVSFAGITGRRPRLEVIGLGLLGGTLCFATVAIVDVRQTAYWPSAAIYLTHGAAAVGRIVAVVHVERIRAQIEVAARTIVERP